MTTLTVTARGQEDVLQHLGIRPGRESKWISCRAGG